ncbi:DUF4153 domain-containing protein [Pontibacter sp. H259]|uniref:DUF4153 domain-containing protein n=1 Tax=Pontibacter sp. H259 TaxID=3133421 RepID=UPI0030BFF730
MSFFRNISLQQLWSGAVHTFLKFPMVLLAAITGTATVIALIEFDFKEREQNLWLIKLVLVCSVGLILFFTLELLARRYKLAQRGRALTWLGGLAFLVLYYFLLPDEPELKQVVRHLALVLALHLLASYAMFLNTKEENAFWQFNKTLFLRVLTSVLYSGVLYIGLVVAIVALDQLFSIKINEKIYPELWVCMVGVFNTWFFLAGVPLDVEELEQREDYPKGLKVFTQFVLLPLVTMYLLILYAYFGKIVVQWEWPKGWVSVLVLVFSVVGVLSLLLIHPIRNIAGNTWIRTFSKWFYRALFPLNILLALAIWRRVSEYGITEERYVVLALAIWLLITVLYFLFSREKNIKFIPFTLSIVALLSAFGPVNMFIVSEWSQVSRLENLLQEHDILVDEKIQPAAAPVPVKASEEISSIVEYLTDNHGFEELEDWFTEDFNARLDSVEKSTDNNWNMKSTKRNLVLNQMGLSYTAVDVVASMQYFDYALYGYDNSSQVYAIGGYNFGAEVILQHDQKRQELKLGKVPFIVSVDSNKLHLQFEHETLTLDLLTVIKKLKKGKGTIRTQQELTYSLQGKQRGAKVILKNIAGTEESPKVEINRLALLIFVNVPE